MAERADRTAKTISMRQCWLARAAWLATAFAVCAVLAAAPAVLAADAKEKKRDTGGNFNERNLKKIIKMNELREAGDNAGAKAILESINVAREKPYGQSKIYQFLGMFAQEEDRYDDAIDYLNKSVEAGGLTEDEELRTLFQVGMLQMKQQRYDECIATIERWMKEAPEITGQAYYTLAIAYYQAGKAKQALEPAKKAVEVTEDPPEAWYRLLLAMYLESEKYDEGIRLLDTIIMKFPNEVYWTQLAALYNTKDQMAQSLAVQQLAKYAGYITKGKDLMRMAQMSMVQGLPHRGAEIMKKGLEDGSIEPTQQAYQTYSDTLLQSREWELALDPIEKAANLAQDGSLWVRHAQVNLQLGDWSAARASLDKAFEKGKLPDEGQAHILYGIAAANDKLWNEATAAFNRAAKYPGTTDVAGKWIAFVEREKMRYATPEEQAKMAEEKARAEAEAAAREAKKSGEGAPGAQTQASAAGADSAQATAKN